MWPRSFGEPSAVRAPVTRFRISERLMAARTSALYSITAIAVLVLLPAGCGGYGHTAHIEKVVPVSGVVTYQGKPLEGYRVVFMPSDGRRPATGLTDASGKFVLGTNTANDGAPPGMNKVSFAWEPARTGQPGQETINDTPDKMPKPKIKISEKYNDPERSGVTYDVPARGASDIKFDLP